MFTFERDQDYNFRFRTNINDSIWGFNFDIGFMEDQYQDGRLINNTHPYYSPQLYDYSVYLRFWVLTFKMFLITKSGIVLIINIEQN